MKWDNREPCASCPYRKDVPVGTWHRSEFENLLAQDADPLHGKTFGCHKYRNRPADEQRMCVGWFLDQQRRGYPSIKLRILVMTSEGAAEEFWRDANDGGLELYETLADMCAENGAYDPRQKREDDAWETES